MLPRFVFLTVFALFSISARVSAEVLSCGDSCLDNTTSDYINQTEQEIPFLRGKHRGQYWVTTIVNKRLAVDFLIDTGANVIQIPQEIYEKLIKHGTIGQNDHLQMSYSEFADGSRKKQKNIVLSSVKVGSHLVKNVRAAISAKGTTPLLGTPVLDQLGSWRIDTARKRLVLADSPNLADSDQGKANRQTKFCHQGYKRLQRQNSYNQKQSRTDKKEYNQLQAVIKKIRKMERVYFRDKSQANLKSRFQREQLMEKSQYLAKWQAKYLKMEQQYAKKKRTRQKRVTKSDKQSKKTMAWYNENCAGVVFMTDAGKWKKFPAIESSKKK